MLTLQYLPAVDESSTTRAGNVSGFSLHARVAAKANERNKLTRLCRRLKDRAKKVAFKRNLTDTMLKALAE